MGFRTKLEFGVIISCATLICTPAFAEDASNLAKDSPGSETAVKGDTPVLDAVVVTAERRAQPLQEVPISVTALTGKDIEESKINSIIDVQQSVPGLTVTQASTGEAQVFIRGIGTDIVGSGVEDAVAVYIDGVYQSRSSSTAMQFIDVDRVEILKGPQGVLYGRNATGGAINIISKAPSGEKLGQYDVQAGSYNQRIVRGTVGGALFDGAVNGRLSFLHNRDEGDTQNVLLNDRGNSSDVNALRGSLAFLPNDKLAVTINAHYYHDNATTMFKPLYPDVNPLFTTFGATVIDDPRTVMQNLTNEASLAQSGVDVKAEWSFDASELTSITAFHKTDYNIKQADLDGTEVPLANVRSPTTGVGIPETTNLFSQEFTLVSIDSSPLAWTGLLSYTHQKVDAPGFNVSFPLLNMTTNSVATVITDALGIGGQATYSTSNGMRLTAGARFSTETKNLEKDQTYLNGALTGSMTDKKTWSSVTPKFVVDYSPDKNSMIYASVTKGFKSGGYNTVAIQPAFAPETAINYEAGIKSETFDGRLHLNLAAFYTKYNDMQLSLVMSGAGGIYSQIKNAAKATSQGVEIGALAKPTDRFELSGGLQFLKARFVEFVSIDPQNPALGAFDHKGNPLSRAPDKTVNLAAQYSWPSASGAISLRGEGSYRSKIYYTPFKNEYASDAGRTIWNVLLNYEPAGKTGIYGGAFVKNLGNKTYTKAIFDPQGLGYLAYYAPARTIGAQAGYRY